MPYHPSVRRGLIVLVAVALSMAACGSDDPPTTTGGAGDEPPVAVVDMSIADAAGAADGARVRVEGVLFVTDEETLLCAAIGESYPVQCLGDHVEVVGVDPADHDLTDGGPGVQISAAPVTITGAIEGSALVAD